MILGVDVGNYTTLSSKRVNFLSKVCKRSKYQHNDRILKMDGEIIYIGEGSFDTEYRKAYKDSYISLLYTSIALSTDEQFIQLAVGLPLTQFNSDKEYLRNRILANSEKEIEINNIKKKISINDIEVFPEGVLAVDEGFEGILIDIGGRTTDVCLLEYEGNNRRIYKPYSLPKGVLNLESDFIEVLNKRYGLDLEQKDMQRILNKGLFIDGKEVDVNFAYDVYREFTDELVNKVRVDYPVRTHQIALIGGGAEQLELSIKNRLSNSFLVNESFYGNAIGYERELKNLYD